MQLLHGIVNDQNSIVHHNTHQHDNGHHGHEVKGNTCKKQGDKEQFFESVTQILDKLVLGRDSRSVMESFTEILNRDWEFRFTFNYLFGEEVYDDEYPFKELMEKITSVQNIYYTSLH